MEQFMNGIFTLVQQYQALVWILAVACLVVGGVMIAIPLEKFKDKGKSAIMGVLIGVGIALCALNITADITAAWGF